MVRRSTPRRWYDERSFPIRVALVDDLQRPKDISWTDAEVWLRDNLGDGEYAHHGITNHSPYARGFYFRSLEAAQGFLDAFPGFELADSTASVEHLRNARQWRSEKGE